MSGSNARAERRRRVNQSHYSDEPRDHFPRPLKVTGPPREPARIRAARRAAAKWMADKRKGNTDA